MALIKRKPKEIEVVFSSELIQKNASQVDYLACLAANTEFEKKLKETAVKIKYFSPTSVQAAITLDKRIENCIGDIKIALCKAKSSGVYMYCDDLVNQLLLLIAERKSITV